jgi:DNA polymerase-3 subunit alpha
MNNIVKKLSPQLHMHVRSLYDADIDPQRLCNKIKELGGDGVAITDHGVVSSIEDYRRVFADNGLKLVPGCELYVDGNVN